jgi:hypothetical protein
MNQSDIIRIKVALKRIVEKENPITVRGVFYRAVSQGYFSNTDRNNYVACDRYLLQIREEGALPHPGWEGSFDTCQRRPLGDTSPDASDTPA